jgi:hypothetical protein
MRHVNLSGSNPIRARFAADTCPRTMSSVNIIYVLRRGHEGPRKRDSGRVSVFLDSFAPDLTCDWDGGG